MAGHCCFSAAVHLKVVLSPLHPNPPDRCRGSLYSRGGQWALPKHTVEPVFAWPLYRHLNPEQWTACPWARPQPHLPRMSLLALSSWKRLAHHSRITYHAHQNNCYCIISFTLYGLPSSPKPLNSTQPVRSKMLYGSPAQRAAMARWTEIKPQYC